MSSRKTHEDWELLLSCGSGIFESYQSQSPIINHKFQLTQVSPSSFLSSGGL